MIRHPSPSCLTDTEPHRTGKPAEYVASSYPGHPEGLAVVGSQPGLEMVAQPGSPLPVHAAEPGSPSAERLRLLASWAASQEADSSTDQVLDLRGPHGRRGVDPRPV
jgi:hypothetical protein